MKTDSRQYDILVIEDNPGDHALIETFLHEQIKAAVIINAKNFREAKNLISADCPFDVILLDLSLPDKTGESLIREIIGLCSTAPVIVLTGYADFNFGVKSLSFGASDYLLKDDLTAMALYKSIVYAVERKKIIAELKESEKRYSEVFDLSPLPMWVVDLDTLLFLSVNKAMVSHYGYSRDELLTMTLRDIKPLVDIPVMERSMAEDKQKSFYNIQRLVTHIKKNGELMSVELQIAPLLYRGTRSNLVIAADVTERLDYIQAIEAQNEKLREISWIQSHVARAPLARIMGLIPLIENIESCDNDLKEMLKYLIISANELDDVIKDITAKTNIPERNASLQII